VDVLSIESIELGKSFLSTSPSDPLHGSVSNQSHVSPFSLMSVIADGVDEVRKAAREELRKRAAQIQGSPRFDGTARFNCSPANDRNRRDLPVQPGPGAGRLTTPLGHSLAPREGSAMGHGPAIAIDGGESLLWGREPPSKLRIECV
jgi:hypothetical protein